MILGMTTRSQSLDQARLQRVFLGLAAFWSAVILVLAALNAWQTYAATFDGARASASESFRKDVTYRSWASMHGGVYVPVTPQTPPNPDLADVPERDIRTPSGKALTLMNPAYMTRQAHELGNQATGSRGHLTSLTPLRAANAPDAWEQSALQSFERGVPEAAAVALLDGQPYFRFMRPLVTEAACLQCHAKQGYRLGDIRGGISASIPWQPYRALLHAQITANLVGYLGIWLLGLAGLYFGRKRLQASVVQLETGNAELKRLNTQLAQSQGQLLQSEKMAAVGQLAAGVAHEINNPIGFVSSNMGTLKDYLESLLALIDVYEDCARSGAGFDTAALQAARQKTDLAYLKEDALALLAESRDGLARVKKIVQDLRDFSRVDSADWQASDLMAGLESTLNVAWHEIKYKAEVEKHYGQLPLVRCHLAQINQVLLNLLINAAQAIAERGRIVLRSGVDGPWVWVSIEDSGQGMTPEVMQRIFEPFYTTKPVGKGTGLGLSLAYDIVTKHGGRIEVTSQPGQGTCFKVWLPVAGPEGAADL